jgi:CSLREA domain-containing protein
MKKPQKNIIQTACLICLLAIIGAAQASAATITVNSTADPGDGTCDAVGTGDGCTLREAIAAAASGDTINFASTLFDSPQTININGQLVIDKSLTINGRGANLTTVRNVAAASGTSRVFLITSGTVNLNGLTITGGNITNNAFSNLGGGISNNGTLTLTACAVTGNINANDGSVSGIGVGGGGIFNNAGASLTIIGSTISGNTARKSNGGGIQNFGTLSIINTTISGNSAEGDGGGIMASAATLINSTVTGNSCARSTFGGGGGINSDGNQSRVRNTIISGNTAPSNPEVSGSLSGSSTNNLIGGNARLLPLGNYGGATMTHALLPDSPAINAGNDCVLTANGCGDGNAALTTDQRGKPRVGTVDIGAFEAPANLVVTNTFDSGVGSLRDAITQANSTADDESISFEIPPSDAGCANGVCTITLTSGELTIDATSTAGSLLISNAATTSAAVAISGNNASRVFLVNNGANLTLNAVTVTRGNSGSGSGGGIFNNGGTVTLTNSTVSGNSAVNGGGIFNFGTVTITNSTISGNSANNIGGGIFNNGGTVTLTNSTVSGNSAGNGGGIANSRTVNARNTIIAANNAGFATDFNGTLTSQGYNLIGSISARNITGTTTGNQIGVNPLLAPLGFYGGSTQTHALLSGSPAIDAGDNCVTTLTCAANNPPAALTTDQRGASRIGDVDIGAFELNNSANGGNFRAVLPAGRVGVPYDYTLIPNVGSPTFIARNGSFPINTIIDDQNALIARGTPNSSGTFNLSITVGYAAGSFTTDYSLEILPPLDSTPPAITPTVTGTLGNNGWYVSDVQVSWSVVDNESPISNQTGCDTQNVTADTSGVTFTCSATSTGGTNSQSVTIKRDATAPTITFASRTAPNSAGWNNSDVTVLWNCSDNLSGAANSSVSTTISTEGANQSAQGICTDNAGNTASDTQSGINIDKTAPSILFVSRTPRANTAGWNNTNVTVNWSCADGVSGVVDSAVNQTVSTEGTNQSATGVCTDLAGNTAQNTQSAINIDKTAPSISLNLRTAANSNGWNNTNVLLEWNCSDALSGAVNPSVSQTVSSEGANQTAMGTCVDLAGNSASDTQSGINIDKTAPALNPSVSPNPVLLGGTAAASPNAADALSGLASASCGAPDTASVGFKSVSCAATDLAGNTNSAAANYQVIYNFAGFFQPIANLPVINQATAGQAIPVKFSLSGNQGLNIFASGYPASGTIPCDANEPGSTVEEISTPGSSGLSYSAGSDQYNYVWKTEKAWKGTCRLLIVRFIDGTEHYAKFRFR